MKTIKKYINSFDYNSKSNTKRRQLNFLVEIQNRFSDLITHPEHEEYRWLKIESLNDEDFNFTNETKKAILLANEEKCDT